MSEMTEQKKIEKAIKFFKSIASDAKVVLDSGFGTNQNESNLVYRNRKTYAELAIQALEEKQKLSDERKSELLDGATKAYEDREKLEIENAKLKEEVKRLEDCWNGLNREFNRVCDEKKNLKEECQKTYNQMMEVEKNAQKEIERLNSELEHTRKVADVIQKKNKRIMNGNEMSAVEVLEWLKENYANAGVMFKAFNLYYLYELLDLLTPREIVDNIQEYEKNSNSNTRTEEETEKESEICVDNCEKCGSSYPYCGKCQQLYPLNKEEPQFKVGDFVHSKVWDEYGVIYQIDEEIVKIKVDEHTEISTSTEDIEHAEPQNEEQKKPCFSDYENGCDVCSYAKKHEYEYPCCDCTHGQGTNEHFTTEEPNPEWVWECHDLAFIISRIAKTEEEAIKVCESLSIELNELISYRKVCRRKEQ